MNTRMHATAASGHSTSLWVDVLRPREHGSWSLALEPLTLGLLAAPSAAGAAIAAAAIAGFLGRRPLQLIRREAAGPRRTVAFAAVALLAAVAMAALLTAISSAGVAWLPWLAPAAIGGAGFLAFDWHNEGRSGVAEILGAAAFASLTAAITAVAGCPASVLGGLFFVSAARAIPTVVLVRTVVRGAKAADRRPAIPLIVSLGTAVVAAALTLGSVLSPVALVAVAVLAARSLVLLAPNRTLPRPRILGLQEMVLGAAYVLVVGLTWPR